VFNEGFTRLETVIDDIKNHDSIVLYRDIGGIGDAVMITGAITGLRRGFKDSIRIVVATIPYVAPVFYNNPDIDWIIDSSQFDRMHGTSVDFGSGKDICRTIFEKAGSLFIGLSHPCPSAQYESANEPLPKRNTSIIKSRQELFSQACDVKYERGDCHLYISDNEQDAFLKPFEDYLIFHVKSNSKSRNLPNNHIDYLTSLLAKKFEGVVLLSHEYKYKLHKHSNVVKLDRKPLRDVMTVIANSRMVIGVDSMGLHIGGGFNLPLYGLFGTVDPAMRLGGYNKSTWYDGYKRCSRKPCWYHPCIFGFCMKSINIGNIADDIVWKYNTITKLEGLL